MTDTITIEDLESFRGLSAELESLRMMREWNYFPVSSPNGREQIGQRGNEVSDPTASALHKLEMIDEKIVVRQQEVADQLEKILNWLDTLTDQSIKAMIHWHYLQGLDWGRTCQKVYGYHNYHTCRNAVLRFMGVRK